MNKRVVKMRWENAGRWIRRRVSSVEIFHSDTLFYRVMVLHWFVIIDSLPAAYHHLPVEGILTTTTGNRFDPKDQKKSFK